MGIWLSTSLVNPHAIGSLIRVFFRAWFSEWTVFVTEVVLLSLPGQGMSWSLLGVIAIGVTLALTAMALMLRAATGRTRTRVPLGQRIFEGTCAACHAPGKVLVGPSLEEIAGLYADNPAGIVAWTEAPRRKREGFPPMPAFKLGEEKLLAVAGYMIRLGSGEPPKEDVDLGESG